MKQISSSSSPSFENRLHRDAEEHGLPSASASAPPVTTMRVFSWQACWIADRSLVRTPVARHGEQIVDRVSRRDPQIAVRRPHEMQAFILAIDQYRRRAHRLHHQALAKLRQGRWRAWILGPVPRAARSDGSPSMAAPGRPSSTGPAAADMAIKPLRLGDQLEAAVAIPDGLRTAQQQNAAFAQGKMEHRDDLCLRLGPQIDQQDCGTTPGRGARTADRPARPEPRTPPIARSAGETR